MCLDIVVGGQAGSHFTRTQKQPSHRWSSRGRRTCAATPDRPCRPESTRRTRCRAGHRRRGRTGRREGTVPERTRPHIGCRTPRRRIRPARRYRRSRPLRSRRCGCTSRTSALQFSRRLLIGVGGGLSLTAIVVAACTAAAATAAAAAAAAAVCVVVV